MLLTDLYTFRKKLYELSMVENWFLDAESVKESMHNYTFQPKEIIKEAFKSFYKPLEDITGLRLNPSFQMLKRREFSYVIMKESLSPKSFSFVNTLLDFIRDKYEEKIQELAYNLPAKFLTYSNAALTRFKDEISTNGITIPSGIIINEEVIENKPYYSFLFFLMKENNLQRAYEKTKIYIEIDLKNLVLEELIHTGQKLLLLTEPSSLNEEIEQSLNRLINESSLSPQEFHEIVYRVNQLWKTSVDVVKRRIEQSRTKFDIYTLWNSTNQFFYDTFEKLVFQERNPKIHFVFLLYKKYGKETSYTATRLIMEGMCKFIIDKYFPQFSLSARNSASPFQMSMEEERELSFRDVGSEFVRKVYEVHGQDTFRLICENPPQSVEEIAWPEKYLKRIRTV